MVESAVHTRAAGMMEYLGVTRAEQAVTGHLEERRMAAARVELENKDEIDSRRKGKRPSDSASGLFVKPLGNESMATDGRGQRVGSRGQESADQNRNSKSPRRKTKQEEDKNRPETQGIYILLTGRDDTEAEARTTVTNEDESTANEVEEKAAGVYSVNTSTAE